MQFHIRAKRCRENEEACEDLNNNNTKKFKAEKSPYEVVRTFLHLSLIPEREIIGRNSELEHVAAFFEKHLTHKKSGSLYISGPPGTGKTHLITYFCERLRKVNEHTLLSPPVTTTTTTTTTSNHGFT
jgi:DNA replication protein DnaC